MRQQRDILATSAPVITYMLHIASNEWAVERPKLRKTMIPFDPSFNHF